MPPGVPVVGAAAKTVRLPDADSEVHGEFLRVLEVVTRMCDHVIEYIEADRAERQLLVETLAEMVHTLSGISAAGAAPITLPAEPIVVPLAREHVVGGSMPAGPEPVPWHETDPLVDLHDPEPVVNGHEPEIFIDLTRPELDEEEDDEDALTHSGPPQRTPVEVRCRFGEGERWVGGFEIVDVLSTDDAWKYRLRRQRDGAILPQLFDAASIRHIETFEELTTANDSRWSRL